jgi:hypothetical protein
MPKNRETFDLGTADMYYIYCLQSESKRKLSLRKSHISSVEEHGRFLKVDMMGGARHFIVAPFDAFHELLTEGVTCSQKTS